MLRRFSQHDRLMGRVLLKIHLNIYFKVTRMNKYMYMYGEQSFVNLLVNIKVSTFGAHTSDQITIHIATNKHISHFFLHFQQLIGFVFSFFETI